MEVRADQQVIDAYHPDLRRTRAASQSIIPVDTKLAAGITRIFPKFCDRFEAISVRVPTINVTAIDLSVTVTQPVNVLDVNNVLQRAAKGSFRSIVDYTELPLVSIDFNHDPHSAIVDGAHHGIGVGVPSQHDADGVGRALLDLVQKLGAGHAGHHEITDH